MRRIGFILMAAALVAGIALADGDTRLTADGSVSLVSGSQGARGLDIWADGTATATCWNTNAGDSVVFYIRENIARAVTAHQCGWSSIDSVDFDLDTATELVYTPSR